MSHLNYVLYNKLFILKLTVKCTILKITSLSCNSQSMDAVYRLRCSRHLLSFFIVCFVFPSFWTWLMFFETVGHSSLLHLLILESNLKVNHNWIFWMYSDFIMFLESNLICISFKFKRKKNSLFKWLWYKPLPAKQKGIWAYSF